MNEDPEVVTILTDAASWLNNYRQDFEAMVKHRGYRLEWKTQADSVSKSKFCFLLGYLCVIPECVLRSLGRVLVVHESDLPLGRGWSPLTWQVLEGKSVVPVVLIEATLPVDSGPIIGRSQIELSGDELVDELREKQFEATLFLLRKFLEDPDDACNGATKQEGDATWFPRRTPSDSELDVSKSLLTQFDLLRVVDNEQYPAWFAHRGTKYVIKIFKE